MDIYELIDNLFGIARSYGHVNVYVEKPDFTDGRFDGMILDDNFSIHFELDDKHIVILR